MQIHELTKRKRTNEGILDGLKAAVNVAKTGADSFASAMIPGYDTAKAGVQAVKTGYKQGGLAGAAKASVSGSALTQAQGQLAQGKLADDPRIVRGKTIQQVLAAVSKDPDIKAGAQKLVPAFQQQFMAPQPDIEYAPTAKGKAELDKRQNAPAPVTPPPGQMLPGTKTNKSLELAKLQNKQMSAASGIKEAAVLERASNKRKADRLAKGITKAPNTQTAPGGAGAFGQMANTLANPTPEKPATGGAGAFGQMSNTLANPTSNYDEKTGEITAAGQVKKDAEDARHAERMKNDPKYAEQMRKYGGEPSENPKPGEPGFDAAAELEKVNQLGKGNQQANNQQSGADIEKWTMSKIKGFTPKVGANQEAKAILSKPLQDIQKVVAARNTQALPQALTNYLLAAKAATMYVNQKELEKKSKPSRAGDFVDNDGDGVDDNATDTKSGYQMSSSAAKQAAINNLRDLGVDTAALAPLAKAVKQGGAEDVKAALGLQEQLQQELAKFKNAK